MQPDAIDRIYRAVVGILVLAGSFYALVIYDLILPELVIGAIISWVTLVLNSLYSAEVASRTGRQQQSAFDSGLNATPNEPSATITTSSGPPSG